MQNIIKMKISDLNDKFEDSPHEKVSQLCIGDFLYGSSDNQSEVIDIHCSKKQTRLFKKFFLSLSKSFVKPSYLNH